MQTNHSSDPSPVKITPNDRGNPAGTLADAELHVGGEGLENYKVVVHNYHQCSSIGRSPMSY